MYPSQTVSLVLFFFCVLHIVVIRCDSIINVTEGDDGTLRFPYPCGTKDVTLQYVSRTPFYNLADPENLTLHPSQSNRISVKDAFEDGICQLHLNISHVNREDRGTYILFAQNNGYIERVGLRVDRLPGKAQCVRNEMSRTGHWVELTCTAPVGDIPGQIVCYQDGKLRPWFGKPLKVGKSLKQTILVQQNNHHVFCCSSAMVKPKGICQCKDFVWDPQVDIEIDDQIDPCVSPKPVGIQTVPQSYPSDHIITSVPAVSETTATAVYEDEKEKNAKISINALHIFLFATIPLYVLVNIAHFCPLMLAKPATLNLEQRCFCT